MVDTLRGKAPGVHLTKVLNLSLFGNAFSSSQVLFSADRAEPSRALHFGFCGPLTASTVRHNGSAGKGSQSHVRLVSTMSPVQSVNDVPGPDRSSDLVPGLWPLTCEKAPFGATESAHNAVVTPRFLALNDDNHDDEPR
jgi:hypothetical protein